MPRYEYRSKKCGKRFEQLRRMADADRDLECPGCHPPEVDREISTFASGGCGAPARRASLERADRQPVGRFGILK
jgi:putative FmdB family regulatory protein